MFTTPEALIARLTPVEKIKIRAASTDALDWMYRAMHQYEIALDETAGLAMMQQVQQQLCATFAIDSARPGF